MELDTRVEKEAMRQEMLEANRIEELEAQEHEYNMRTDADYFCEWVLKNFKIKDEVYVDIQDVLNTLNKKCNKYGYSIDILLDYMKEI